MAPMSPAAAASNIEAMAAVNEIPKSVGGVKLDTLKRPCLKDHVSQ